MRDTSPGNPGQNEEPDPIRMNAGEASAVDLEINNILGKGVIRLAIPKGGQMLSNIFVRSETTWGFRPIMYLMELNQFLPYQHFKMEDLKGIKSILKQRDFLCKLDPMDAYYTVQNLGNM